MILYLVPVGSVTGNPPRRVISLVYDDSVSMYGSTKWASTNYAMQVFVGLLDEEDELYFAAVMAAAELLQRQPSYEGTSSLSCSRRNFC